MQSCVGESPCDTGSCALRAYLLLMDYCLSAIAVLVLTIVCEAVERNRKETATPSEFQSRYHSVEEGQLSSEMWQNWQGWVLWLGTFETPSKEQTSTETEMLGGGLSHLLWPGWLGIQASSPTLMLLCFIACIQTCCYFSRVSVLGLLEPLICMLKITGPSVDETWARIVEFECICRHFQDLSLCNYEVSVWACLWL